jgi:hypothetical protein
VAIGGLNHLELTLGGVTDVDRVEAFLEGPDAAEWVFAMNKAVLNGIEGALPCERTPNGGKVCVVEVEFRPHSVGAKRAVLRVTKIGGGTATATLTGTGVIPLCTYTVVPCNYAHLYDGTFSWTIRLQGPHGSDDLSVIASIEAGRVNCNGSQVTRRPDGVSWTGTIVGRGLIGVEFIADEAYPLASSITVACPSARFPDHADGSRGWDSEPAEVGSSFSFQTPPARARVAGEPLAGTLNYPPPETDALNGVTGTVSVQWNLWRTGQPPPPPPGGPAASGPP